MGALTELLDHMENTIDQMYNLDERLPNIETQTDGSVSIIPSDKDQEMNYFQSGKGVCAGNPEYIRRYQDEPEMMDVMYESFPTICTNLVKLVRLAETRIQSRISDMKELDRMYGSNNS